MFCPRCGNENAVDQRYCRGCGLSLTSAALVAGGSPVERATRTWTGGWSPVLYALLLIVFGIAVAAAFGPNGFHVELASGIGGLIAILGVGLLGLKGVLMITGTGQRDEEYDESIPPSPQAPAQLERPLDTADMLEQTTRPLEPASRERP